MYVADLAFGRYKNITRVKYMCTIAVKLLHFGTVVYVYGAIIPKTLPLGA